MRKTHAAAIFLHLHSHRTHPRCHSYMANHNDVRPTYQTRAGTGDESSIPSQVGMVWFVLVVETATTEWERRNVRRPTSCVSNFICIDGNDVRQDSTLRSMIPAKLFNDKLPTYNGSKHAPGRSLTVVQYNSTVYP